MVCIAYKLFQAFCKKMTLDKYTRNPQHEIDNPYIGHFYLMFNCLVNFYLALKN